MVSRRKINLIIYKPENYKPTPQKERRRVTRLVMRRLFELADRFDGSAKISIIIKAKGNA